MEGARWTFIFDIVPANGKRLLIDGYPGLIHSSDDYGVNSAGIIITETTISQYPVTIPPASRSSCAPQTGFYFRVLQEGEVGAGDDILKITDGPERISVADVDALLYLPGHSREQLERALQVPALSQGWQSSFQAMLQQDLSSKTAVGNPGLANEEQPPAWPGFRQLRVANIHKESASVTSFILSPIDGQPLPLFQAGQFVVLRLHLDAGKSPVLRSYSLSDLSTADHFRISVKNEL